jgi:heptosyltransferase-2
MFKQKIRKILIIRYDFVGDTILTIPFIKNLKQNLSEAKIDVLVSQISGQLLCGNPDVNKIFYFSRSSFHKYENVEAVSKKNEVYSSILGCAKALRKEKYDLIFVLKRSFSSAILAFLIGAKYRVGFSTQFRTFMLTQGVKYTRELHEVENFLNCLRVIGIKPELYLPLIYPTKEETLRANGFLVRLNGSKPKVLIHATSAHPYKMWPKRYFAALIDNLYKNYDAQFVFTGAKFDKSIYEEILKQCVYRNKIKYINLCGFTNLRECYAIYQGLDLAVCVDTGNSHLAACAGIPTYVLYGPTSSERWLPVGKNVVPVTLKQLLPCQPCEVKVKCSHLSCMKILTPEFVFGKLQEVLENSLVRV